MEYPNPKEFAAAVVTEMKESGHALWIDPEVHAEQHQFIAEMIAERKERAARNRRIGEFIAGSVLLSAILACIGLLGAGVLSWFRAHAGG